MTTTPPLHALAQMSAERLMNCLADGILIALFAWMLLRLSGRRNSGTRFAVWFCALLAIAFSPFLQMSSAEGSALVNRTAAAIVIPRSWALYLFVAWATIAAVGLARVAAGLWHVRTIRKNCIPIDSNALNPIVGGTLAEFRSIRAVEICVSDELRVPTAIGFVNPAVVFPAWAMGELSTAELNPILLHELAHLRRWDDWTNLAQKVLRAVFFFHPAVWFVENRLSLEREMACDDIVLAQTANPRAYAECLVSLAEKNLLRRGMALAQAVVGRMRQTTQRVLQILDARRPAGVKVWKPAPWVVGVFSIACLVSSAHAPKLVAFGDTAPAIESPYANAAISGPATEPALTRWAPAFVPANFVERVPAKLALPRRVPHPARHSMKNTLATNAVQAIGPQQKQAASNTAKLVLTNAPLNGQPFALEQAVFVVVEGQPYGNSGAVLWQLSVWRITVRQASPHIVPATSSKSI
jgi:beta-lactamase regulating signal transducer with metallopeptidase domain